MGYVYLLTDGELYKIGVTRGSIDRRIKKLQTGNPYDIVMVAYHITDYPFKVEKMLHSRYGCKRFNNEWFELHPDDVVGFADECRKCEDIISALSGNPFFMKKS